MSKPLTAAEKRSEARARKAEKNGTGSLAQLFSSGGAAQADWSGAAPQGVLDVVIAMSSLGGAVTFGMSRDGGAYMLTLLLDGDRTTLWCPCTEDVDIWMENTVYLLRTAK